MRPSLWLPLIGVAITAIVGPIVVFEYRSSREARVVPRVESDRVPQQGTGSSFGITDLRRGEKARDDVRRLSGLRQLVPEENQLRLTEAPRSVYAFAPPYAAAAFVRAEGRDD